MPRIKIAFPDTLLTTISIPVRISDINYGNHVGNDAFVSLIHEARLQWLRQHGYTELNFDNAALIMADLGIEFKEQAYYGDTIQISIASGEISRVSFELFYLLSAERAGEKIIIGKAKTAMVCYDYANRKTVQLSEKMKALLSGT